MVRRILTDVDYGWGGRAFTKDRRGGWLNSFRLVAISGRGASVAGQSWGWQVTTGRKRAKRNLAKRGI